LSIHDARSEKHQENTESIKLVELILIIVLLGIIVYGHQMKCNFHFTSSLIVYAFVSHSTM